MEAAIIKYNAGNIRSVDYALKRLGIEAVITDDPEVIRSADRVIFPGVGEASTTMAYLRSSDAISPVSGELADLLRDTEVRGVTPLRLRESVIV